MRQLGEGGMGTVFSAFDDELDRRVAIKVINQRASETNRTRLRREAQAMAKLSHPNVAHVYEVGTFGEQMFVVMEYVRGQTLKELLADDSVPVTDKVDTVLQAGEGLAAAHEAGLLHRDFKPANVMVGKDGRARVLDFGLVRAVDEAEEGAEETFESVDVPGRTPNALDEELTAHGAVMGTPAYMSPEQHYSLPVDVASDIFSLTVVLYEALYGTRPFKAANRLAFALATRMGNVQEAPAGSDVSSTLREILLKGLDPDPRKRWQTIAELVAAVRNEVSPPPKAGTSPWLMVGGLTAVLAVAGLAFGMNSGDEEDPLVTYANEAREAGAKLHYVYGTEATPLDTSYVWVIKLEELGPEGVAAAEPLREDFSTALVKLGDDFWSVEGGATLAREHYRRALLFDADQAVALERSGATALELAGLKAVAASGEIPPEARAEIEQVRQLVLDSGASEAEQIDRAATAELIRKARRANPDAPILAPPPEPRAAPPAVAENSNPAAAAGVDDDVGPEPSPDDPAEAAAEPEMEPEPAEPEADPEVDEADPQQARKDSKRLAKQARSAGDKAQKKRLLEEALSLDPRNANAHLQLAKIYRNDNDFQSALDKARLAVKHGRGSTKRNAYFEQALIQHGAGDVAGHCESLQAAQDAGHTGAGARIEKYCGGN